MFNLWSKIQNSSCLYIGTINICQKCRQADVSSSYFPSVTLVAKVFAKIHILDQISAQSYRFV